SATLPLPSLPTRRSSDLKQLTDYYGVITYLDMQFGRILQALKDSGEYDNTLILFSSDHGLALGSHGLFGKQNIYEDGMKVPLILDRKSTRLNSSHEWISY